MLLAATSTASIPPIICTILLIATVIALIIGLAEALGFGFLGGRLGNNRFGALVLFVILLVVYIIAC